MNQQTENPAGDGQGTETVNGDQPNTGDQVTPAGEQQQQTPPWVEKRIAELAAQKNHAKEQAQREKERADQLEREVAAERARQQGQNQGSAGQTTMPTLSDFDFDETLYAKAMSEYHAKLSEQAVQKAFTTQQQQEQEREQQRQQEAAEKDRLVRYHQGREAIIKAHPDFDEVTNNEKLPLTQNVVDGILMSDNSAAVAYHIAKNPVLAAELSGLDPYSVARKIGQIEARLQPNTVSNAPPPIDPPAGGEDVPTGDPDKMSTEDWMKWDRAKRANRKG